MTQYISLVQQKGGVGKSTIAFNLCGYFLSKGKKVLAIDSDMPQGTFSASSSLIEDENFEYATAETPEQMASIQEQAYGEFDIVITDTPPRIAGLMNTATFVSDLVIVPITTSAPDLWSAQDLIKDMKERFANEERKPNIRVVWNKFRENSKISSDTRQAVIIDLGCEEFKTTLSNLVAYSNVMSIGKHVTNYNHKKAKSQFNALGDEITKLLKQDLPL